VIQKQLEERAGIRNVGSVIATPQDAGADGVDVAERMASSPSVEAAAPARPALNTGEKLVLPAVAAAQVKLGPEERPDLPVGPVRADAGAAQELFEGREHVELQLADNRQDLERAFAAASQSGVARSEEHQERRRADVDLMGEPDPESGRERIAREALTQVGVVEARTEQELVTRYADRAFAQDLGRPESPKQTLGDRNQPSSDFDPEGAPRAS
jgi:hypothetical protein